MSPFESEGEREGRAWSRTSTLDDRRFAGTAGTWRITYSHIPVGLKRGTVGLKPTGLLFHQTGPNSLNQKLFYFPYWPKFVNYVNPPSVAPKFTKLSYMIEWKMRNNFTFWSKSKFETEYELNFLGAELLLKVAQIYWGFEPIWKNLINSLKFPICLDLLECEFRLTWLYGEIWSFHTCSIWLDLNVKKRGLNFEFKLNQDHLLLISQQLQDKAL
jgi:hypothetical protein